MAGNRLKQIKSVTVPSLGQLPIKANETTFTPSGDEREHHAGQRAKDGGFTETPTPAQLEVTINDRMEMDYYALNKVENENITIEYTGGGTHVMTQAWCSDPCKPETGVIKVTFTSNESQGG